jgi:hypothetical protein
LKCIEELDDERMLQVFKDLSFSFCMFCMFALEKKRGFLKHLHGIKPSGSLMADKKNFTIAEREKL